jgi:hypothetical protein
MKYEIYIGGKLYKTITTEGGYSFSDIHNNLHQEDADGKLTGFDLTEGVSVKPVLS